MNKKTISKIITSGSAKKRGILLGENVARLQFGDKPILTDAEADKLSDSFTKPNEIRIYNQFRVASEKILQALVNIQGVMFNVKTNYSNLRGYILVWNTIENAELLVNSVLHEIKDPEERKRIAEAGAEGVDLLFSKTAPDKEGFIEIDIRKDYIKNNDELSLYKAMLEVRKQAEESAIRFISWRQAILDYMEETGFNVKSYKDRLQTLTDEIYKPIIGWSKYESSEKQFLRTEKRRMDRLKDRYSITPNLEELSVDEEIYNKFKRDFLE